MKEQIDAAHDSRSASRVEALCAEICRFAVQTPLAAGDRLPTESSIAQQYRVSRTVVREALSRLQAAGVVQARHGVGTFLVRAPTNLDLAPGLVTVVEVLRMLELRICLESEAAGLAAMRRSADELWDIERALNAFFEKAKRKGFAPAEDFSFHLAICRATHNQYFIDVLQHFGSLIIPRAGLKKTKPGSSAPHEDVDRINNEHEDIHDAIARQDADAARIAMRAHLNNSRERLRRNT